MNMHVQMWVLQLRGGREGKEATLGGGGVAIDDGNTWPRLEWAAAMATTMEEEKERRRKRLRRWWLRILNRIGERRRYMY